MKKTLLTAALIAALSATTLSANAFCWSNLNPFTWGTKCCGAASNCECQKPKKEKCKKTQSCTPAKNKCQEEKPKCNSCTPSTTCNPCDKLQEETER